MYVLSTALGRSRICESFQALGLATAALPYVNSGSAGSTAKL